MLFLKSKSFTNKNSVLMNCFIELILLPLNLETYLYFLIFDKKKHIFTCFFYFSTRTKKIQWITSIKLIFNFLLFLKHFFLWWFFRKHIAIWPWDCSEKFNESQKVFLLLSNVDIGLHQFLLSFSIYTLNLWNYF